jgi:HSP20 family protein
MDKQKENHPKDLFSQSVEVLGEDFWQEISELIPNTGPRTDIYHTPTAVVVLVEVTGLDHPEQIEIRLDGQTLIVEGEIPCLYPVTENRISRKERFFGHFRRSFILPRPVSAQGISARYHKGLLVVELQIEPSAGQTNISVEFG